MFNDLPDNKAIKMGGVYIVKLPLYYRSLYEINGVRSDGGLKTVPTLDHILSVTPAHKDLKYYVLGDTTLSVEEYNVKNPSNYYDNDYEGCTFDSLEHEYEVKKEWERVRNATPIYEETPEELVPVEIEVIGSMVDTGSKFISTPYQIGKAFFDSKGGIYSLNRYEIARDEVEKVRKEYPDAKVDLPTHSGLEYLKVNGTYIFTNSSNLPYIKGRSFPSIFTTLKEAKETEAEVRNIVRTRMLVEIKPITADSVMLKDVYKFLNSVRRSLSDLEVKQKSQSSKRALFNIVSEKMTELENIVEED